LSTGVEPPYTVLLVRISKSDEPAEGGWRWHKWGPYIGDKKPTREYLVNEPEIDAVYVFEAVAINPAFVVGNEIAPDEKPMLQETACASASTSAPAP
jgi:hypothetical protein